MGNDGNLVKMLKVSNKYILIALISPKYRRCVAYLVVRKKHAQGGQAQNSPIYSQP
jgi:hypothetical protein